MEPYTYPYEHVHHVPPARTKLQLEYERMRQLDERRDVELDDWHGQYGADEE